MTNTPNKATGVTPGSDSGAKPTLINGSVATASVEVSVLYLSDFRPRWGGNRVIVPFTWDFDAYTLPVATEIQVGKGHTEADAVATLKRIATAVGAGPVPLRGYMAQRKDWLQAHYQINLRGRLAPRFRPSLDPRKVPETLEQATYACDRQVIDLHWLHATGVALPVQQPEFGSLLTDGDFDFETAAAFARANVTSDRKIEVWLALGPEVQWQLAGLQTKAVRKRWATIRWGEQRGTPGMAHVAATLLGASRGASKAESDELAMRWAVERMLPGASASERARLFALARGLADDPKPHVFQRQQSAAMRRISLALPPGPTQPPK